MGDLLASGGFLGASPFLGGTLSKGFRTSVAMISIDATALELRLWEVSRVFASPSSDDGNSSSVVSPVCVVSVEVDFPSDLL